MEDRWEGGEADGQGYGGNGGDGTTEGLDELLFADIEHFRRESVALVINLGNAHAVGEGRDVEHVQEGCLGRTDLVAGLDELQVGGDFNGTAGDLCGDTECLKEGSLAGFHARVAGGNPHVDGGNGTSTGWSSDLIGKNLVTDILELAVGEDEANVAPDVRDETLVLGMLGLECLKGTTNLFKGKKENKLKALDFPGRTRGSHRRPD